MSKIVLQARTKENFKIHVRKIETGYESSTIHSFWNCGYISIPVQNAKFIYSDRLSVHGGITYDARSDNWDFLVIGFDCAHCCDAPWIIKNPRSIGYCKNELINLSKQIKKQILNGRKRLIKNKIKEIRNLKFK